MSVFARVRQTFCGLHGHDSLLQFGQDRMYLEVRLLRARVARMGDHRNAAGGSRLDA